MVLNKYTGENMREIKFRAWDKKRKEWYGADDPNNLTFYDFHLFGECTLICPPRCEDLQYLEVTQYTGLKDKNNKEIYEGDIVKAPHDFGPAGFSERVFKVYFNGKEGGYQFNYWLMGEAEVIGNIYENPELLESADGN